MVLTPSTMLPLGTPLPAFQLEQVAGDPLVPGAAATSWSTVQLDARPVLVLFLCAHCPFVKHIEPELSRLEGDYGGRLQIVAISSNSTITHPQDGPAGLRAQAERCSWRFPYLFDADQSVARAFQAACTPDLFLFGPGENGDGGASRDASGQGTAGDRAGSTHRLVYRGQLDGSRPGNEQPLDGRDLRAAIEALLAGRPITPEQIPSIGCNIKWHPDG
ncbi:MAG: thioredoxin family protein [Vulcanococcus sp.]